MIYIAKFSEEVYLEDGDWTLTGATAGTQTASSWNYNPATSELALTYAYLPPDTYTLTLTDGVTDLRGNPLDGDGDGIPGGHFILNFQAAISGDVNLDGKVDAADYITLKRNFGTLSGANWRLGDLDGDADVDRIDLQLLRANLGATAGAMSAEASTVSASAPAYSPGSGMNLEDDGSRVKDFRSRQVG